MEFQFKNKHACTYIFLFSGDISPSLKDKGDSILPLTHLMNKKMWKREKLRKLVK